MPTTMKRSRSKPEVEFPYGVPLFLNAEVVVSQLWIETEKTANINAKSTPVIRTGVCLHMPIAVIIVAKILFGTALNTNTKYF